MEYMLLVTMNYSSPMECLVRVLSHFPHDQDLGVEAVLVARESPENPGHKYQSLDLVESLDLVVGSKTE